MAATDVQEDTTPIKPIGVVPDGDGADEDAAEDNLFDLKAKELPEKIDPGELHVKIMDSDRSQCIIQIYGKTKAVCSRSLIIFHISNPIRRSIIRFVEWRWFDRAILFLIMFNGLLLSIYRYRYPESLASKLSDWVDPFLCLAFTMEFLMKIIAFGFFIPKHSYLRDGWNWLDFIVVVTGDISLAMTFLDTGGDGAGNFGWLRVFRVLRPLRSLTVMPDLKVLVNTVLLSIPRLGNVFAMGLFLFVVFGILAINFWGGVGFRQCREFEKPVFNELDRCWSWPQVEGERLCGGRYMCEDTTGICGSNYLEEQSKELRPTFNGAEDMKGFPWCEDTIKSTEIADFNFRFTHFDHLPAALLVIFQCMTLEGWTDIMYMYQDAHSDVFASLYFIVMISLVSFFLLSVILAVIDEAFNTLSQVEEEDEEENKDTEEADPVIPTLPDGAVDEDVLLLETLEDEDDEDDEDAELKQWGLEPWLNVSPVRVCRALAFSEVFTYFIMFFILANVATMMLDKHPPPDPLMQSILEVCNAIFTSVFTIEMAVMITAVGPQMYWTHLSTGFDGIVVLASLMESFTNGGGALSALRGFRLLRIFRLAKKWTSFRVLLKSMLHTVRSLGNYAVLLVIMMYVFTLMASLNFATKFHFDENGEHIYYDLGIGTEKDLWCPEKNIDGKPNHEGSEWCIPRANFDTFLWSFVTIFQILSGENWNTVMYDGMKVMEPKWVGAILFLAIVVIGQFVILNLFLAILMSKFEESSSEIRSQEEQKQKRAAAVFRKMMGSINGSPKNKNTTQGSDTNDDTVKPLKSTEGEERSGKPGVMTLPGQPDDGAKHNTLEDPDPSPNGSGTKKDAKDITEEEASPLDHDQDADHEKVSWPRSYAFCLCGPRNCLRKRCLKLVTNKVFDNFILTCIIISSLSMAISNPNWDPNHIKSQFLVYVGVVFQYIFTVEMVLKMLAMGLIWGKNTYLMNPWNRLDFIVVMIPYIEMLFSDANLAALKTLRVLRALRPLRVISRYENLKLVVNTLFKSGPEMFNLVIVGSLFFLIFGLFGLSYFKGAFMDCTGDMASTVTFSHSVAGGIATVTSSALAGAGLDVYTDITRTPVCVDTVTGHLTGIGSFDEESDEWVVQGSCPATSGFYLRPSDDTPVCVGRCRVDLGDNVPPGCPPDLKRSAQLPSVCPSEQEASVALKEALDSIDGGLPDMAADEEEGRAFFEAMMTQVPMACGSESSTGFLGCRERFCPDGSDTAPDADKIEKCVRTCDSHPIFCKTTCDDDSNSPACRDCRVQCKAQCECPFCEPYVFEAAMCVEQGGLWQETLSQSFDNIGTAMLTLFEISTTEGWVDVMYAGVDAVGPYMRPKVNNQELWSLFFVAFIFVGSFFILQLCIGVIVDNFNKIKEAGGDFLLTDDQRKWLNANTNFMKRKVFFGLTNLDGVAPLRRNIYQLVTKEWFENLIMCCIVLNTVVMAARVFPAPSDQYVLITKICNYVFAAIFTSECVLKLVALHGNYFKDGWNLFDFTCVVATIVGILIDLFTDISLGSVMSAIRIFRIARLFRLVKFMKGLNRLFTAFILCIPKLMNVFVLLTLLLFLFTVLGVQLFGKTKFLDPHGEHANFHDFWRGCITLIRCMTGEGFNEMMHSLSRNAEYFNTIYGEPCYEQKLLDYTEENTWAILKSKCLIDRPNGCSSTSGTEVAYLYWITYTWVITFVILNLVIAVILEGFDDSSKNEEGEVVDNCIIMWKKYDKAQALVLDLAHALQFIDDVCDFYGLPRLDAAGESDKQAIDKNSDDQRNTVLDLQEINMKKIANCQMYVSADQQVHLVHAMQWAVKMVMTGNDPETLNSINELEENDPKIQAMIAKQEERQKVDEILQGVAIDISIQVATIKIQRRLKVKLAAARERIRKQKEAKAAGAEPEAAVPRIAG